TLGRDRSAEASSEVSVFGSLRPGTQADYRVTFRLTPESGTICRDRITLRLEWYASARGGSARGRNVTPIARRLRAQSAGSYGVPSARPVGREGGPARSYPRRSRRSGRQPV